MPVTAENYERHRERMLVRDRESRAAANDIASFPDVVDRDRKESCRNSLRLFCETYRPAAFSMGWSEDHKRVLERIEHTVANGGLFGLAMPRGNGKTTICVTAAIWALLYGHRNWVCLVGSTAQKAQSLLKSIKTELRFNALLLEDFPDVCVPIRKLEGRAARANGQTYKGVETGIEWLNDRLTFPTVEDSEASGAVVTVAGITGDIRGQQSTTPDGRVIRPDYVLLDDPQTRESAGSAKQTEDRLSTLNGDILGLAGPGVKISGVMPCTVIARGDMADQILDRELNPEWHGERTQLLYGWPKHFNLWNTYQETREEEFRNGANGEESCEFYEEHREEMDEGCTASWDERHNEDELSGIQHAMNLYFRDEAAFWAEFQNMPLETQEDDTIDEEQIVRKVCDLSKGMIHGSCDQLVAFVDVQKEMLFYCVAAFQSNFTGHVIDYGAYPDQKTSNFRYAQAKRKLSKQWPGQTLEVVLKRALAELTEDLCGRTWKREDGAEIAISKLLIDANWGLSRDPVYEFCRSSSHRSVLMPSHGKYVGASTDPLNARVARRTGQRIGTHWRIEKARDNPSRYVLYDTNYWKSFTFSRLATDTNTTGSLSLFQADPRKHRTFAKHLKAEYPIRTEGKGREVDEWKLKPDRSDNHWLDCLVGCCVAASVQGSKLAAVQGMQSRKQKKPRTRGVSYL